MTVTAKVHVRAVVVETTGFETQRVDSSSTIADVVGNTGKRETVTLANGFTALSPPTGVQGVVISFVSGAFTFTLKGVTGDTGIAMSSSALAALPVVLPLSAPSIGITCTGAGVVDVLWV